MEDISLWKLFTITKNTTCRDIFPNGSKDLFCKELAEKNWITNYEQQIVLGDFNGILEPKWDKSKCPIKIWEGNYQNIFKKYMLKKEGLTDIWRICNQTSREYTSYSHIHKTFSQLDMILVSKRLVTIMKKIEILPKVIADHNLVIWIGKAFSSTYSWCLN